MLLTHGSIEHGLFVLGLAAALLFLSALAVSAFRDDWRLWPVAPRQSAASFIVWTAFRLTNVATLLLAAVSISGQAQTGTLHAWQISLLILTIGVFALYVVALWTLGKDATYCSASGLETRGLYRFSRNPQYATAIAGYVLLAGATGTLTAGGLALVMAGLYAGMAVVEEPWLEARYGAAYNRYRNAVPRFLNGALFVRMASRWLTTRRRETQRPQHAKPSCR